MKLKLIGCTLAAMVLYSSYAQAGQKRSSKARTDAQVRKAIIKESIQQYPGNCPCPYNVARNGSSCGRRSAYSRAGGYSPLCYDKDVTINMVKEWRERH